MPEITVTLTERQKEIMDFVVEHRNEVRRNRNQYPTSAADICLEPVVYLESIWGQQLDRAKAKAVADAAQKAKDAAEKPAPKAA